TRQAHRSLSAAAIQGERKRLLRTRHTYDQAGESARMPELSCSQGCECARQADYLPIDELAFAVTRKYIHRVSTARSNHQIQVAAASKFSGCQKIRPHRDIEHLGIRKKWRWELTPGNGQKRRAALGSEGIQIAAMKDYN